MTLESGEVFTKSVRTARYVIEDIGVSSLMISTSAPRVSRNLAKWRGVQPAPVMSGTCGEIHVRTVAVRASFLAPETRPSGTVLR